MAAGTVVWDPNLILFLNPCKVVEFLISVGNISQIFEPTIPQINP